MNLTERRAEFVYEAARLAAIAAGALVIPLPLAEREPTFRPQFLELIERQMGDQRCLSPKELHDSWVRAYLTMGWRFGERYDPKAKTHPDLVPYAELDQFERDKDALFLALCEIARLWIYDSDTQEYIPGYPGRFAKSGS